MTNRQFSERIGNIDDRLVRQAEKTPNYAKTRRMRVVKRAVALAAAVALMACGCVVGALAFSRETVVEVEVPAPQETLELRDIGITLILPDDWRGRYALETHGAGEYLVYNPAIRADFSRGSGLGDTGGMLFYIRKWDRQLTEEQWRDRDGEWNYAGNRYIMATKDGTYLLYYASDVQCTMDTVEEYQQMESEISEIRFVVDSALA